MPLDTEQQKALAAREAANLVQDGHVIGLGTGTTVAYLLQALAERVRAGLNFVAVPTSQATAGSARALGIALASLEEQPHLDLDIDLDGADEVAPNLDLMKGRGGALLREKIVASAAAHFVVMVDETKLVPRLGERMRLPVEVVPFGWRVTLAALSRLDAQVELRGGGQPFRTDNGNLILDCRFPHLSAPEELAASIKRIPGVVEHGLFLGMASKVLVAHADGSLTRLER